jgi:hypothetical protein
MCECLHRARASKISLKNVASTPTFSGDQRGHVKPVTHWTSAAVDCTFAAHFSAIAVERRHSNQCCDLAAIELSKLRHLCQEFQSG